MKPYGNRIPRVNWRENHGCPCCDSFYLTKHDDRKPDKVRERQLGKRIIAEAVGIDFEALEEVKE